MQDHDVENTTQPPAVLTRIAAFKEIASLAGPMAASRALSMMRNFVGSIFIARFSVMTLSAGGLIYPTQDFFLYVGGSMMNALGTVASRLKGEQAPLEKIGEIYRESQLLGLLIGVATMIPLYFSSNLLFLLKQPAVLDDLLCSYFHLIVAAVIPYY